MPLTDTHMLIAAIIFAYVMGSIPFGLLLTKAMGLGDIRKIGSGNIGATNVLRTGNKKLAAIVLLLDGLKGAAAVLVVTAFVPQAILYAGIAAVLGHVFPVWLKFKGGKGVATAIGVLFAVSWQLGLLVCATWLIIAFTLKISSLSAIVALGLSPAYAWLMEQEQTAYLAAVLALLTIWRHKTNIERLLKGQEPKIGQKKEA